MESVLAQEVCGMEVIVVDDGSTDGSSVIADSYRHVPNVTIIHQSNKGLSEARNAGLSVARGAYVTFVDSDDYLAPGVYASLLKIITEQPAVDMLEYSVLKETEQGLTEMRLPDQTYTDVWRYWFETEAYLHCYACNKIFRRALFATIRFPKGKKFEDVFVLPRLLRHVKVVRSTSVGFYHYTYNRQGITALARGEEWRDLLQAHLDVLNDRSLQSCKGFGRYYAHVLNVQLHTYELTGNLSDIRLPVLPFYDTLKLKLLGVLGLKKMCLLHRLLHQLV